MVWRASIVGQTPDPALWRLFCTRPGTRSCASVPERVLDMISDF